MKFIHLPIILICALAFSLEVRGQINADLKAELQRSLNGPEKKLLEKADKYYASQDYLYALNFYDSLYKKHSDNLYLGYLLGTVQSYDPTYYDNSEKLIRSAETLRTKLLDYDYYLGKALENNDKFDEAVKQYEQYLRNPLPDTLKTLVNHQIQICRNSAEQIKKGAMATITNLGAPLNKYL
jgi:tetratricopeptide (TPR) repeat protein